MKSKLFLLAISTIFLAVQYVSPSDSFSLLELQLVIYVSIALLDLAQNKALNLFQVWIAAFIFIFWGEALQLCYHNILYLGTYLEYLKATLFYFFANNIVLFAYIVYTQNNKSVNISIYSVRNKKLFGILLFVALAIYLSIAIPKALISISHGRQLSDTLGSASLMTTILGGLGLILPALLGYYFNYISKRRLIGLALVAPVIMTQLFQGTRFRLLFAFLPYLITSGFLPVRRIKLVTFVKVIIVGLLFAGLSDFVKINRTSAGFDSGFVESTSSDPIGIALAKRLSNEGCLEMSVLANRYFETHELKYGTQTTFILYFWVPRSIWPSKPTPVDYWLIRQYSSVPDTFSTASGFLGDVRADFGICVALIFSLFLGILLRKADIFVTQIFCGPKDNFNIILASCLFPYVFFFVRSPITASTSFIFELVIFLGFRYCITQKNSECDYD